MPAFSSDQTMERARSALAMPTLYALKAGGLKDGSRAMPARPGEPTDVNHLLAQMQAEDPQKARNYLNGLARIGLAIEQLPREACDCSGFVTWALGIARHPSAIGWVNTDAMHKDARGRENQLFVRLDQARIGALIVYPRQGPKAEQVGHVGLVSEVDAQGHASRVIHCSPHNFEIEPPAGGARNAIAETGTEVFDRYADGPDALKTMLVLLKAHA
ncbi:MAG: CHAP domain-containing protein [Rubrivivax sp.]|nr:CHAP domain-containing protein [Rubrivivax sp.]